VGDTIIGIKGRVGFAALIIIKAHHLLETHLGKWQQYWKEQLGNWYGMLFHEGQFLDP
jgi:argininosuccinate synthase